MTKTSKNSDEEDENIKQCFYFELSPLIGHVPNMLHTLERQTNMKWCHFGRRTHSKETTVCYPAKDIFNARRKDGIFRTFKLIPQFNCFLNTKALLILLISAFFFFFFCKKSVFYGKIVYSIFTESNNVRTVLETLQFCFQFL